jgi:hypothetical protein
MVPQQYGSTLHALICAIRLIVRPSSKYAFYAACVFLLQHSMLLVQVPVASAVFEARCAQPDMMATG